MMTLGMRYVVTKASDDETFEIGDHIWPEDDGSVSCREAGGWVDVEDVPAALVGVETVEDQQWVATRRAQLLKELEKLG
jgi:hypothetical protein